MRGRSVIAFALAASATLGATTEDPLATGAHRFTADRLSLWYRVAGPAHGLPVIFLHGGPAEGSQGFARTIGPALERRLRMVYFDQRGAGHSDRPEDKARYTMTAILADIEALRIRLGAERVALIGHSYGFALALEYAAAHPERVARIVLVGAVPDQPDAVERECARLKTEDPAAYAQAVKVTAPGYPSCIPFEGFAKGPALGAYMLRASGAKAGTMEALDAGDRAEGVSLKSPAHTALADPFFKYRFTQAHRLTMPVLVIAGAHDRLTDPAPARALTEALPHGRFLLYPDAGHFAYVDDERRFARDAIAFLR